MVVSGIAIDPDRFVMLMTAVESLRDMIIFPKTQCVRMRDPQPAT